MKVVIDKDRFSCPPDASVGLLVTLKPRAEELVVVGQCACVEAEHQAPELSSRDLPTPDWEATLDEAERHFPCGCEVGGGVWVRGEDGLSMLSSLMEHTNMKDVFKPAILVVLSGGEDSVVCHGVTESGVDPESLEVVKQNVKDCLSQTTAMFRLRASFPVCVSPGNTCSVSSVEKQLQSSSTVFFISSCHMMFSEATPPNTTLATALRDMASGKTKPSLRNKSALALNKLIESHVVHSQEPPLGIELLEDASPALEGLPTAPVLSLSEPLPESSVRLVLPVDVLALLSLDTPLSEVAGSLKRTILAHLRDIASAISWKADTICSVSIHHTPLPNQHCLVTLVYPHTPLNGDMLNDDELLPLRQHLHHTLCLPNDIPYFRLPRSHGDEWLSSSMQLVHGPQLKNPHKAVKHSPVKDGVIALVQGDYLYYHYMQESFNDDGWGCAYRSLQTLWSWFLLQNFTQKTPPSHKAIQETLVQVGDKEPSLVGSKEWIGSFEVSTCLNQLLQVQCKIHHCSSGANMASVGRVLLHHFQSQGTPVMIGGGVLAHTILGVDFSESTGDIQFLILDPHYTGRDDLKTIVDKGWCGWKGVTFWNQTAHYNLCLPQCPFNYV